MKLTNDELVIQEKPKEKENKKEEENESSES